MLTKCEALLMDGRLRIAVFAQAPVWHSEHILPHFPESEPLVPMTFAVSGGPRALTRPSPGLKQIPACRLSLGPRRFSRTPTYSLGACGLWL